MPILSDRETAHTSRLKHNGRAARERLDRYRDLTASVKRGEQLEPDLAEWLDGYDEV